MPTTRTPVLAADERAARRLALRDAVRLVVAGGGRGAVAPWLLAPNIWLDWRTPVQALADGDGDDVHDAAMTYWRSGT